MGSGSFAESSTLERAPAETARPAEPRWRPVARFAVAVALSALICLLVWTRVPRTMSGRIDIVGYPTFTNWDLYPSFWAYRLVTYAFPILALVFYAVLRRVGPLRRTGPRPARGPIELREPAPAAVTAPGPPASWLGVIPRLALPLGVVVIAAGTRSGHLRAFAAVSGLAYLALVAMATLAYVAVRTRRDPSARARVIRQGLALANGILGTAAAFLAVWYASRNTVVSLDGTVRHYPWMPAWLAALGFLGALWWAVRRLRRGGSAADTERLLLTVVVGAISLFLAISYIAPQLGYFQGFDGGQELAGARLLDEGYVPWRDFIFIHGLFLDVLRANIAMAIFGNTVWAVSAGVTLLFWPLCYVSVFLFAARVSKCNPWFLALIWVAAVSNFFRVIDNRFMLVPITYLVMGEALRRRGGVWYVGLTVLLFVEAILIPETGFLTAPALVCILAADLLHRERGVGLWRAMHRTRWTAATGVVCVAVFGAVLAGFHAVTAFVAYYRVFGPGHNEAGAIPPIGLTTRDYVFFSLGIAGVLITVWTTVWRLYRRAAWEPLDWVALAAAGFAALYGEKALGRFDLWHVAQVLDATMPLIVLWLWRGLNAVNGALTGWSMPRPRWGAVLANATTVVVLVIALIGFAHPLYAAAGNVDKQYSTVAASDSVYPGFGYAVGPPAVDAKALADLQTALDAYGGRDAPVFDMTNSIGYTYYLLDRVPATRFIHVSMAIPQYAQRLLIADLRKSRPPVVIYDATGMGLSSWDGIINGIRHYEVSDYILKGWVPVMRTHGNLLLVRRDLVAREAPLPALSEPPQTTDLWFSGAPCDWGTSAAFLQSLPEGPPLRLPLRPMGGRTSVTMSGWAADPGTRTPASTVVIADGDQAVATITPSTSRPDVAAGLHLSSAAVGFGYTALRDSAAPITAYQLSSDGKLHPLAPVTGPVAPSVRLRDGRVLPTDPKAEGYLDVNTSKRVELSQVDIPAGTDLSRYSLAKLSAGNAPLGHATIDITDAFDATSHRITATQLPGQGNDLAVRVGSCLQWHGYDPSRPLYVLQTGGTPATSVTLSGVKQ